MGNKTSKPCPLGQELEAKTGELEAQQKMREGQLAGLTLDRIASGVVSKKAEIASLVAATKGRCANELREIVVREVIRSADGLLWCREYEETQKSRQRMSVYTGSNWTTVEPQQWMDFIDRCAERCGIDESELMNHKFMNLLYEGVAFNLKAYRRRMVPAGEVWLNVRNGTLVISKDGSVRLRSHDKDDLFTYTLPYPYDERAECPLWHRFLDRVLPEAESRQVLGEFIGYCMMSDHLLEKMLLLYGEGLNGKSVTLEVIEALLGSVNVSYLSLSDLTNDEVKRAGIEGKMLNISHESGKDVNPNVLKQLTSGEPVVVKHLYHDPYETSDYGKQVAAFNILPRAENTFGFFRRLIILPYQVTIPRQEIDPQLALKLKSELPGILNWVLKLLPGLMTRGEFTTSASCENALERYRLQSDSVRLFISEMCQPSDYTTDGQGLFNAYRNYCAASSLRPLGKTRFYDRLENLTHSRENNGNQARFKLKLTEI